MKKQSGFSVVEALLCLAVLAGVIAAGLYVFKSKDNVTKSSPVNDEKVKSLQQKAVDEINQHFSDIENNFQAEIASASATDELCERGENNWKRTDSHVVRCSFRKTKFYGFNSEFRQTILQLENTLIAKNWKVNDVDSISSYISEYYDKLEYKKPDNTYLISDLPKVLSGYKKDTFSVAISYSEQPAISASESSAAKSGLKYGLKYALEDVQAESPAGPIGSEYFTAEKYVNAEKIFEELNNKFIIALAISAEYFRINR